MITLASFFAVSAAHKTQKPLFALETLIGILMGAAEDEHRTRPEQTRLVVEPFNFLTGYPLKPGHPATSITCHEGLTTLPWQR
jgi:hypothetical protein